MLWFSTVSIMLSVLHTHTHLHMAIIRQVSKQGLGPETKQCSFGYQGALRDKCFHIKSPKVAHCCDQWKTLWLGKYCAPMPIKMKNIKLAGVPSAFNESSVFLCISCMNCTVYVP